MPFKLSWIKPTKKEKTEQNADLTLMVLYIFTLSISVFATLGGFFFYFMGADYIKLETARECATLFMACCLIAIINMCLWAVHMEAERRTIERKEKKIKEGK